MAILRVMSGSASGSPLRPPSGCHRLQEGVTKGVWKKTTGFRISGPLQHGVDDTANERLPLHWLQLAMATTIRPDLSLACQDCAKSQLKVAVDVDRMGPGFDDLWLVDELLVVTQS